MQQVRLVGQRLTAGRGEKISRNLDRPCDSREEARLGRDLRHLVNIVPDLTERGIGLKVITGQ